MVKLAVVVLVADQLTKAWALSMLADGPIHMLGPLRLFLVRNSAAAFGLGGGLVPLLSVLALGVVVYLVATGAARSGLPMAIAMGLLLGGALGNLADRAFRGSGLLDGAVIDFLDVGFWPVFNLADVGITLGCVTLMVAAARGPRSSTDRQGER